jgi:hypothetical protein
MYVLAVKNSTETEGDREKERRAQSIKPVSAVPV